MRGIPVQDLPENQDESVRYTVIEQTGEIVPWDLPETGVLEEDQPIRPKRGKARKWADVKADAEASGDAGAEVAATAVRELGS